MCRVHDVKASMHISVVQALSAEIEAARREKEQQRIADMKRQQVGPRVYL
jgi:hypothetical protein